MKKSSKLISILAAFLFSLIPNLSFGQIPNLRTAADFALFTTSGGLGNTGTSQIYGGAVGTNFGSIIGFETVKCVKHLPDAVTAQCSLDLQAAYTEIHNIAVTQTITASALSGGTLTAGVYLINSAANLIADLTLDAQNNPGALFIFNITDAFTSAATIKITLINGALAQNVYWNVGAAIGFGAATSMKGTFISQAGAITIGAGSSLEGRALTIAGAVTIDSDIIFKCLLPTLPSTVLTQPTCSLPTGTITITAPSGSGLTYSIDGSTFTNTSGIFTKVSGGAYIVIAKNSDGCTSWKNDTIKSYPHAPDLKTAADFVLFTTIGNVGNTGSSTVTGGAVGTNAGAITGFGSVVQHIQDPATIQCSLDLQAAFDEIQNFSGTQTLAGADLSGVTFTAGVYFINSAATLSSTLTFDAQGNPDALFIIKIKGAFGAVADASIIILKGASVNNIYFLVDNAVSIGARASMKGTFLSHAGAIDFADGASLEGRALTIAGAVNINNSIIAACIRPATPTVTLTQPSCSDPTRTITVTQPAETGMKYRIDYCDYTNTSGVFLSVPPGTYQVTAKNSAGCVSSFANVTIYEPETWTGLISTDWNDGNNWLGGVLPTCRIVIPDAATTAYDPVLPLSPAASVNTITIESGGILNGGSATTITVAGGTAAWQNKGTFNPGTSTVIFANSNATIADPTDFFNVTIASGAALTPQSGNIMRIAGALALDGTGVLNAALLPNTIEFNGTAQNVINPNGTATGYYNLILSGSGTKILPGSALSVAGDFTITGTATTTLAGATTVGGNLTIGNGTSLSIAPAKSLTVSGNLTNNAGTSGLVLESTASGTSSLIHNTAGVSATVQRYLSKDRWHIIGTPVSGQSIPGFITNVSNTIPVNGSNYGMMYYSESGGGWVYYTNSASGNLSVGTGYLLRHTTDDSVSSYGMLNAASTDVTITKSANGWNCIGNPFPCSIAVRSDASTAEKFLTSNAGQLDPSYAVLYLWDEPVVRISGVSYYKILGNAGFTSSKPAIDQTYLQSGQGFIVKSKESGGTVGFTTGMRIHENTGSFFKSTTVSWPGIDLIVSSATKSASTAITLHEGMTTGLDVTYDAGLLGGDPSFRLYTRLVEDNGVNFMLQCLPIDGFDNMTVPVGFDCLDGGTVTFTSNIVPLPAGINAVLSDNLLGKYTDLLAPSASYTTNINPNTSGIGRFFLNISTTPTFINTITDKHSLDIYSVRKEIIVNGKVNAGTRANLYDLVGRLIRNYMLSSSDINTLPADNIPSGVYILQVFGEGLNQNSKLFLK